MGIWQLLEKGVIIVLGCRLTPLRVVYKECDIMTRGLGRNGAPLGSSVPEPEDVRPKRTFTQAERDKHNMAVKNIAYYRSPSYPGYGTPDADTMVRKASCDLAEGAPSDQYI
jgi:hypothetical protein